MSSGKMAAILIGLNVLDMDVYNDQSQQQLHIDVYSGHLPLKTREGLS